MSSKRTGALKLRRRDLMGATAAATGLLNSSASSAAVAPESVYTRVGVRPFINLTAAYTINGGLLTLPPVKAAMDDASRHSVNIDELMEKVGERIASLFGAEAAIVTAGCAAALTHATAACVAGADPEKMQLLPRLEGMKDRVIMPRVSRNEYDHAIRAVGVEIVMVSSREEFRAALGERVAMVAVLGERPGDIPLREICQTAHEAGVPVLVDASAEVPTLPNAYVKEGADLVGISGGKYLAGPQCSGMLIGRKDLIRAAWVNSAPHHGFGRSMKVGKEEIMGLLTAVETFVHKRKYEDDLRVWSAQLREIAQEISKVAGVTAVLEPAPAPNPHPKLRIAWDTARIPLSADDVYEQLLAGEPRIMSHAAGAGNFFYARAAGMKVGDEKLVGRRLSEVFRAASGRKPKEQPAPAADISGRWVVHVRFASGSTTHELDLRLTGDQVSGAHRGKVKEGRVSGTVMGDEVRLLSSLPYDSINLQYHFRGRVTADGMAGAVDLGEYGKATWEATRA